MSDSPWKPLGKNFYGVVDAGSRPVVSLLVNQRIGQASQLLDSGDVEGAAAVIDNLLTKPRFGIGELEVLGAWCCSVKLYAQSVAALQRAVAMAPTDKQSIYLLAYALAKFGRFKEAIEWGEKGAAIPPVQPGEASLLAKAYHCLGSQGGDPATYLAYFVQSAKWYRRTVEMNKDDWLARYDYGYVLNILKEYGDAEKTLRASLEINPTYSKTYRELELSLSKQGKLPALYSIRAQRKREEEAGRLNDNIVI